MADPYEIKYTQEAIADIRPLRAFDQRRVLDGIWQHLSYEPTRVSRSRIKSMTQPFWSQYRLSVADYRAYYDVDDAHRVVHVLRVLFKGTAQTPTEPP